MAMFLLKYNAIYKLLCSWKLATRSLIINIKHVDQERPFSHGEETKHKLTIIWASVCLAVLLP